MALTKLKEDGREQLIPYFWSVDGIATVIGGVSTVILAILYGFNFTFYMGILVYVTAAWFFKVSMVE